jgi:hypothetical protein
MSIEQPPSPGTDLPADKLPAPPIGRAEPLMPAFAARTRLCVLCGRPLRAGQHMIRVHGSTIHAQCSSTDP